MKKVTLLIFLLISFLSKAQNYQPLNSNSLQVFFQQTPFYSSEWGTPYNMWGTRIDSVELTISSDSVFYNYSIVRDTAVERDIENVNTEHCIWISAPNWSGNKIIVSTDGHSWFFNEFGDSILLKYSALQDSSWIAFIYEDGSFLRAIVQNVFLTDDVWTQDSVKTISFQHIDSTGNSITDNMNGKTIELYQNYGFRKTFDFVKFPFDTVSLFQLDINYINRVTVNSHVPQVGDIISYSTNCHNHPEYPKWGNALSKKIVEVIPYPNSDSLRIQYFTISSTYNIEPVYNPQPHLETTSTLDSGFYYETYHLSHIDTFISIITGYQFENIMPREHAAAMLYSDDINGLPCPYPSITTDRCSGLIYSQYLNQTDSCILAPTSIECLSGGGDVFTPYYGETSSGWYEADGFPVYSCSYQTLFLKSGDFECGNYWFVGVEDYEELAEQINIYPNPASNTITIQSPLNYQFSLVRILNAFGQEVYQSSSQNQLLTFDISPFTSGIYFISLSSGEQTVTKKFVKE